MRILDALLGIGFLLCGCGSSATLTLDHEPLALAQSATAHVTLWGHDDTIADSSATAIERYSLAIDELPVDLTLDLPASPHELIDTSMGSVERDDARFYFSVVVDVDGDGQVCLNDFVQDFLRSDFHSMTEDELATTQRIFVAENSEGSVCQPIE